MRTQFRFALAALLLGAPAAAATCANYAETVGQTLIDTPSGLKIISTAKVTVPVDDTDLYLDALTEATMEAKSSIASFLNEEVSKTCETSRSISSLVRITSEGKSVDVEKVKSTLCSLKSSASALLRGVVTLGSCYTPGKYVLVTVGIKPETISVTTTSLSAEKILQ